jgi:hypothetical protein
LISPYGLLIARRVGELLGAGCEPGTVALWVSKEVA